MLSIGSIISVLALIFWVVFIVSSLVKVSPHEKAVKERLSRYQQTLWPGRHFIIPLIDSAQKVDMRERVINTPPQEMITKDNAVVTVDAVIFTQVYDPVKAVYEIQDAFFAISNLSITTLRAIIGTMTLDQVLWERQEINIKVQTELSEETAKRGLSINKIEIQRIDPPRELMDAMNQQKIAQQEKRAAILKAEWEKEAAIRAAEWAKEAAIRDAEWYKEKQVLEATGKAEAIERIAVANAKATEIESKAAVDYFTWSAITQEQLRVIEESMKNNTKYVMWSEIFDMIKHLKIWG